MLFELFKVRIPKTAFETHADPRHVRAFTPTAHSWAECHEGHRGDARDEHHPAAGQSARLPGERGPHDQGRWGQVAQVVAEMQAYGDAKCV